MSIAVTSSSRYRKFIRDRNRALERILQRSLIRMSLLLDSVKDIATEIGLKQLHLSTDVVSARRNLDYRLGQVFTAAADKMYQIAVDTRRMTYVLTYAGEAEGLARATGTPTTVKLTYDAIQRAAIAKSAPSGGNLSQRLRYLLGNLQRRVTQAMERVIVSQGGAEDMVDAIQMAFPRKKRYKRPPPAAKSPSLSEAKRPDQKSIDKALVTGFIDDEAWQRIVDEYTSDFIPTDRTPEGVIRIKLGDTTYERYEWEVEQEMTQDFVELVRVGQIDAAKENGITEFVWIAIIDDKTDDCCAWRDGLTTREIQQQLAGRRKNDKCRAYVPPAHFNCRCDLAPMTDEMPERLPELGDFETWLK